MIVQTRIQKLSSTETSLFTKHETKQFEFQVPVSYNRGIEKDKVPNIKLHSLHENDTKYN